MVTAPAGKLRKSGVSARTTAPGLICEYSIGGSRSGTSPQKLSPVVSAEWALLTPAKMLSRMGVPAGTQLLPETSAAFQFQSYLAASISSPGPEAKYSSRPTEDRSSGRWPGSSSTVHPLGVLIEVSPVASLSSRNAVRSLIWATGAYTPQFHT